MTPAEIIAAARNQYSATGDTFWSDAELAQRIYAACQELVRKCGIVIEGTYTTTTVADQQEYSFPTYANGIRRVEYAGKKLFPTDQRGDDIYTVQDSLTTGTGEPEYYFVWDRTIFLRPIPSEAKQLKIFTVNDPQPVTTSSVLEVPLLTHNAIVNFLISEMAAKDQNFNLANYYRNIWQNQDIPDIRKTIKLSKRRDSFTVVKAEEIYPYGFLERQ